MTGTSVAASCLSLALHPEMGWAAVVPWGPCLGMAQRRTSAVQRRCDLSGAGEGCRRGEGSVRRGCVILVPPSLPFSLLEGKEQVSKGQY